MISPSPETILILTKMEHYMKLLKAATLVALSSVAINSMANTVTLTNESNHAIPIRYEMAYHTPGKPRVFSELSTLVLKEKSKIMLKIPDWKYEHSGLAVLGIKKDVKDLLWTPTFAELLFDQTPGCWVTTCNEKPHSNLVFSYKKDGVHGSITCSHN